MVTISKTAVELLKAKLLDVYTWAGGLDIVGMDDSSIAVMKETLLQKCSQAGMGFRMRVDSSETGELVFRLNLDRTRQGDHVLEIEGLTLLLDPGTAARVSELEVGLIDVTADGLVLR